MVSQGYGILSGWPVSYGWMVGNYPNYQGSQDVRLGRREMLDVHRSHGRPPSNRICMEGRRVLEIYALTAEGYKTKGDGEGHAKSEDA